MELGDHSFTVQSKELVRTKPVIDSYSEGGLIDTELIGPLCSSKSVIFSVDLLWSAFLYKTPFSEPT